MGGEQVDDPVADKVGGSAAAGYKAVVQGWWALGAVVGSLGAQSAWLGRRRAYALISVGATALTALMFLGTAPLQPAFLPVVFAQGFVGDPVLRLAPAVPARALSDPRPRGGKWRGLQCGTVRHSDRGVRRRRPVYGDGGILPESGGHLRFGLPAGIGRHPVGARTRRTVDSLLDPPQAGSSHRPRDDLASRPGTASPHRFVDVMRPLALRGISDPTCI